MAVKVESVVVAQGANYNEANVSWKTSGAGSEETIQGFQVLVDGVIKAEPSKNATSAVLTGIGGSHTFKVRALVLHDAEAQETAEIEDGLPPRVLTEPTVTGTLKKGETLTANTGTWKGKGVTFAYQWLRCLGTAEAPWTPIAGATSSTYALVAADVGHRIRCNVMPATEGGIKKFHTTAATAVVLN